MIRNLQPDDFEAVVEMFRFLRLESPEYAYVADDPEFVLANMAQLWTANLLFGVIDTDGRGAMVGVLSNTWFSRNIEASEQILFVYPPYRGSSVAVRMIQAFETAARDKGAELLHVGVSTGLNEPKIVHLYEKLGFKHKGTTLIKRLKECVIH